MKKNKINPNLQYLAVVAIVAIVGVIAVIFYQGGNLEGAATYQRPLDEKVIGCIDDDPTNNRYVAGTIQKAYTEYLDYCKGDKLHQFHCSSNGRALPLRTFTCPNGCVDGACIR